MFEQAQRNHKLPILYNGPDFQNIACKNVPEFSAPPYVLKCSAELQPSFA